MPAKIEQSRASRIRCRHCGTPFVPSARESEFCCSGCRFVYHLLHRRGLEDFYRFGERRAPVSPAVFDRRDLEWLREAVAQAEREAVGTAHLELRVQGISCAGCVWLLEAIFREQPGAVEARVSASDGGIRLEWQPGELDLFAYAEDVQRFGYLLGPRGSEEEIQDPLGRRLGICAALALNTMLFALPRYLGLNPGEQLAVLFETLGLLLATASMAVGGVYFFRRAWGALRRGEIHMDLPISLGLLMAYAGSAFAWRAGVPELAYFDFVSIFTFLMLLGRWLQGRSIEANRRRLLGQQLTASNIRVLRNGVPVKSSELAKGERFTVSKGGLVPVRSRLLGAPAVFALDWINGEPEARNFPAGAVVPSGARHLGTQPAEFQAQENWQDSLLARLLAVEVADCGYKSHLQRLIRVYLLVVLGLGIAGFAGWLVAGAGIVTALQVFISVLVVSCPCAIGVALPLRDDLCSSSLQSRGVFLRTASLWPRLRKVHAVLFDKTGTLTFERLSLANPDALDRLNSEARAALLALAEDSLHPVASCLREQLLALGSQPDRKLSPREIPGLGIEAQDARGLWRLGRSHWAGNGPESLGTVFALDGVELARFHFEEKLRPQAQQQVQALRRAGLEVALLSGDNPERVRSLAEELGLSAEAALGGLSPEDKARQVRERWAGQALVIGDGANDALAFREALCRGTPAVESGLLENSADFYLLGRSLDGLVELFQTGAAHFRTGIIVFLFALIYNFTAIIAALGGWMNPLVAAIIMPLSSLISVGLVFLGLRPIPKNQIL